MDMKKNFKAIFQLWKEEKLHYVKPSSFATYVMLAEKHIIPAFGDRYEVEDGIQQFVLDKLDAGLSLHTVKDVMMVMRMIVRYGEQHGLCSSQNLEVLYPHSIDKKPKLSVLTRSDQQRLMNHLKEHLSLKNLGLYLCLTTGMRIGEICALQWNDINTDDCLISVNKTTSRTYNIEGSSLANTQVSVGKPKTINSVREIPFDSSLLEVIIPLKKFSNGDNYVLTNCRKPMEPRTYRCHFYNQLNQAGIDRIKFHGLRHTFATRCIESQCDYKTVSAILGHANISTTLNLYVHPDMEQKRRCISQMLTQLSDPPAR